MTCKHAQLCDDQTLSSLVQLVVTSASQAMQTNAPLDQVKQHTEPQNIYLDGLLGLTVQFDLDSLPCTIEQSNPPKIARKHKHDNV